MRPAMKDDLLPISAVLRRRSIIALFAISFAIFVLSPISQVTLDPLYSILVSQSILKHGTPALDGISIRALKVSDLPAHRDLTIGCCFYQLIKIDNHVLYSGPQGTPLLSLPFVALLNAAGISALDSTGHYQYPGEAGIQKIVSSLLMAGATCLFFTTACELLPWSWSLAIATGAAFGTQIWSTATRALWSHTWEVFLGACLVLMLLKREQRSKRYQAPILATLVSWLYFVRPTGAIVVVAVSILLFYSNRDEFLGYAATGLFWLGGFLVYSWIFFGQLVPDYYLQGSKLNVAGWLSAAAGCLFSPSRGLFVFVPSILVVIYVVVRHRRALLARRLVCVAGGIICAQLIMVAGYPKWWGGYCYGPRLFTDLIPWFVLLAILGFRAYLDDMAKVPKSVNRSLSSQVGMAIAFLLTFISIVINGYGAFSAQTQLWNSRVDVDVHPDRIWDWESPQFLAGIVRSTKWDR